MCLGLGPTNKDIVMCMNMVDSKIIGRTVSWESLSTSVLNCCGDNHRESSPCLYSVHWNKESGIIHVIIWLIKFVSVTIFVVSYLQYSLDSKCVSNNGI